MSEGAWVWDDASIPDDSNLLRRIPRKPSCVALDAMTGEPILQPDAFTYDHGSGLSVSVGFHVPRGSARTLVEWTTHALAVFSVAVARTSHSGVVHDPTEADVSHGVVRVAGDPHGREARRAHWLPLRSRIREAARYVDAPDDLEDDEPVA